MPDTHSTRHDTPTNNHRAHINRTTPSSRSTPACPRSRPTSRRSSGAFHAVRACCATCFASAMVALALTRHTRAQQTTHTPHSGVPVADVTIWKVRCFCFGVRVVRLREGTPTAPTDRPHRRTHTHRSQSHTHNNNDNNNNNTNNQQQRQQTTPQKRSSTTRPRSRASATRRRSCTPRARRPTASSRPFLMTARISGT